MSSTWWILFLKRLSVIPFHFWMAYKRFLCLRTCLLSLTDLPWKKPLLSMCHVSVKGGSESNILPSSIRKLPFYAQHHTWRDDDAYTSTKETPAPADKPPVGQVSALPAEREGERKNIVCFSIFVHRSCFFFYNIHYTVWLCNALNSWCNMDVS